MKKIITIAAVVLIVLVGAGIGVTNGLSEGMALTLRGIDLSGKSDGLYKGTYNFKRWSNTVTVEVKNHAIVSINQDEDVVAAFITHCSDEIIKRVIDAQDTQVDAVAGATVTSKAYLKAIETALGN